MKNQVGVAVLTAIVVTAGAVFTATKSDADLLRQARDREEIEQLMWRYARALDTANADGYAANYTVDGQFGSGANATKGREALKKMIAGTGERQAAAKRPPMYHMHANHAITFTDKDHARFDAYYITARAAGGQDQPLQVLAVGRSVDELVRLNGKWLIQVRNVAPTN